MTELTQDRRDNLGKLAAYLERLPADYGHFGMGRFVYYAERGAELEYARRNGGVQSCGTAACAAGHGPAAGVLVPERHIDDSSVDWWGYVEECFTGREPVIEDFLFNGLWEGVDNHHHGAAARIRYVLDQGAAPDGWGFNGRTVALYAPYRIDAKVTES